MAASNEGGTPPTDEIVEEIVDEIVDEVEDDSQATAQKDTSSSLQNTNRKAIIYSVICLAIFGVILYGSNKKNPSPKRKKSKD